MPLFGPLLRPAAAPDPAEGGGEDGDDPEQPGTGQ